MPPARRKRAQADARPGKVRRELSHGQPGSGRTHRGLAGGAFIGWVIDQFAGTRPWGLLVMLFVGMGVAFRNIIRISNGRS
jgi:ATP synthase protein I